MNGEDSLGLSYEREVKDNGITEHKHYLSAGGMVFALQVSRAPNVAGGTLSAGNPAIGGNQPSSLRYMHHDHLGSVAVVTNEAGAVLERLAFDPWGKRRNINGKADTTDALVGLTTDRGYTEHEHLDEMGVIHMNGRIYDPLVGRMMSADPFIQAPSLLQSYNRYSYVMNNPLNLTDPSGYFSLRGFFRNLDNLVRNPSTTNAFTLHRSVPGVVSVDNFVVKHNWAFQIGRAAAGAWGGPWAAAGATGYYTYLTTGCESCSVKAFGLSLGTAYAFQAAGDAAEGSEYGAGHYASHAAVGCASSVAGGGQCGAGALSAVAGLAGSQFGGATMAGRFTSSVIAGGVASRLAGGSFIDGAQTAAYGFLFNECAHTRGCGSDSTTAINATGNIAASPLGNITGLLAAPSVHMGIEIVDGYGTYRIDGAPSCSVCIGAAPDLVTRWGGAAGGPILFSDALSPPIGVSLGSAANSLRSDAMGISGRSTYSYPNLLTGAMNSNEYNSNSFFSTILQRSFGNAPSTPNRGNYIYPGLGNIIPRK